MSIKDDKFLNNPADLQNEDSVFDYTNYECCNEEMIFAMKDSTHEFLIGLSVILKCLYIAEQEGFVPKIPSEWWNDIRRY